MVWHAEGRLGRRCGRGSPASGATSRGAAAYAVLMLSLLLTALASWYYVRQSVEAQNRARFNETTQATKAAIYRRVKANIDAMFGARGLLLVSDSVEQDEWDGYVTSIEAESPT